MKKNKNKSKKEESVQLELDHNVNLDGDAKTSIFAILLVAIAILLIIGFFGGANILGEQLNKFAGLLFGWGKWLFPLILFGLSGILIFRKKIVFYVFKMIGISIMFLCLLSILHIYFEDKHLLIVAKAGEGGGYIGYFISLGLIKLAGRLAGSIILVTVFLVSFVISFNFPIANYIRNLSLFRRFRDEEESEEGECEDDSDGEENLESIEVDGDKGNEMDVLDDDAIANNDLKNNISKIEFVEDPFVKKVRNESENREKQSVNKTFSRSFSSEKSNSKSNPRNANQRWVYPAPDLLDVYNDRAQGGDIDKNKEVIRRTFQHFGINVDPGEAKIGPTVTQYSFRPAVGVKLSRIVSLGNDLSLALAAHPIRIEAPIPGKSLVGVEVPNTSPAKVGLRDIFSSDEFNNDSSNLPIALGRDVEGNIVFKDLAKMPHLLVAGATGTGKSVCVNIILMSLLYRNSPDDLRLILVDPKRVELSLYKGIPHLLSDVIVENAKVVNVLKWAVGEMERRYILLQDTGSKDLISYRSKIREGRKRKYVDPETGEKREEELEKMPYIVIVIDELADLMASHGKEVEGAIIRLAQMARAIGIHLIVSTQRPSVEVLTGLIKANITTRIALQVATQIDSRTILDMGGAERLVGKGDMLFLSSDSPKPRRVQCPFVSEAEIKRVVRAIKNKNIDFDVEMNNNLVNSDKGASLSDGKIDFSKMIGNDVKGGGDDEMYEEAKKMVIDMDRASTSLLQRRLRVGYSRAARLIDMLEENGVIGPQDGSKPREVLVGKGDGVSAGSIEFSEENE